MKRFKFLIFVFLSSVLSIISCGKNPPEYTFLAPALKLNIVPFLVRTNSAESLVSTSNSDYSANRNGLVTAQTLSSLATNWETQRPTGISGKLVILQIQAGTASGKFVPSNLNTGVYSYLVNPPSVATEASLFGQTRNNGIVDTETMVPTNTIVDAFLSQYGIHPGRDLIVLAMDTTSENNLYSVFRAYYALRYWGIDRTNLAVLNGSIDQAQTLGELFTVSTRNTAVKQDFVSIRNLYNDNTILQATMADVLNIVLNGAVAYEKATPIPSNGVTFLDFRSPTEFNPPNPNTGQTLGPISRSCTAGAGNCRAPFDGTIAGAVNIPWNGTTAGGFTDGLVINGSTGAQANYRFKTREQLQTIFGNAGINGSRQLIAFCRNGQRSSVGFFVTQAILGFSSRLYDGSWVEWSSFAARTDDTITWTNLPTNSVWRTDRSSVTSNLVMNTQTSSIPSYSYSTVLAFSRNGNKIIDDDKSAIRGASSSGSSSGGSGGASAGAGGNACGG